MWWVSRVRHAAAYGADCGATARVCRRLHCPTRKASNGPRRPRSLGGSACSSRSASPPCLGPPRRVLGLLARLQASRPPGLHPLEKCDGTNNSPELSKMLKRATTGYICYFKPHVCIQSLHRRHRQHGHPRTSTRSFFAHHKQQISKAATMRHARAIIKRVAVLKQHQQSLRTGACRHILLYADLSSCGA